jgi:S-DNA-T family DNA segregation ATPase FtsK/SpoIIIE
MALLNKLAGRTASPSRAPSPLPEKIAVLLRESRWLVLVAVASFLALSLWGYHRADPGWSHAVHATTLHNPAGRSGAWLADLMLYVFGVSAWWWIALLLAFVWWGYRRLDGQRPTDRRPLYIALAGFVVLLVASSGLETLRFYTLKATLPVGPGGVMGLELRDFAVRYLGYTGATLTLLAMLILGWSIFSGMSWISAAERAGTLLEGAVVGVGKLFERWQDRRIGREVARERKAVVDGEKKRGEAHEPSLPEKPETATPPPPKQGVKRSDAREPTLAEGPQPSLADRPEPAATPAPLPPQDEQPVEALQPEPLPSEKASAITTPPPAPKVDKRIARERQPALFPDAVEGALLPPLHLLEPAPPQSDRVRPETLEYTSRLIERKLADFGVQVTVTAAYPGPVITRYEFEPAVGVKGAQILNLAKDLARSLSLTSVRVVETVPGKSSMAIELPNPKRQSGALAGNHLQQGIP